MCSAHLVLKPPINRGPTREFVRIPPTPRREEILFLAASAPLASPRLASQLRRPEQPARAISLASYLPSARYPAETPKPSGYLRIIAIHLVLSIRVWSSRLGLNSSFSQNSGGICVHRCHYAHGIVWNGLPRGASKEAWLEEIRSLWSSYAKFGTGLTWWFLTRLIGAMKNLLFWTTS